MSTLFVIESALSDLMETRQEINDEICLTPADLDARADALRAVDAAIVEYVTTEVRKADNIARYVRSCEEHAEACKREAERLKHNEQVWTERKDRIKALVLQIMRDCDKKKIEGATYMLKRQANGGVQPVEVVQPELVPEEFSFVRWSIPARLARILVNNWSEKQFLEDFNRLGDCPFEPDRQKIRVALERGEGVPGCRLAERGEHVRIG